MSDNETEVAPGLGHNFDIGLPSIEEINARLQMENAAALDRVSAIVAKAPEFYNITSDADDSAATEFMVKTRARYKASESDRIANKSPFDDRASAVQQFFKTKILDPLTLVGTEINKAQTAFKLKKAEAEKKAREEEAKRLRAIEDEAKKKRDAEEKAIRDEEDRQRKIRDEAARKAREDSERLAAEAARKRNADNKAAADAAAKVAREKAAETERLQREEDERITAERAERDEANRLEENRIAEERAAAEEFASASLADLSRNRGEKGGVSSLRQTIAWRDINRDTLDYAALGPYFKDAHLDTALKAYADANKATVNTGMKTGKQPLTGVIFYLEAKNSGRQ